GWSGSTWRPPALRNSAGAKREHRRLLLPNQRLKLTGAAILVFRASTSLQAAPAAWPSVRRGRATSMETLMSEKKAPGKRAHAKGTPKSAKRTAALNKKSEGFTDEERAAMKERANELKADKADGERAVLAKIAAMPQPDRVMAERLHAIIQASAPALSPRLWYGMPAYARDGKVVCFFQSAQQFK